MTRGFAGRASVVWLVIGVAAGSLAALAVVVLTLNVFGSSASASAATPPHFVEEAAAAGVQHVYDGDFTFFVGGGVAAFDCDDDGRPDLYFAGGTNPAALYRNESPVGGELRFAQMPDPATDLKRVVGAYPVDIDGDGWIDLAVLRYGENVLLRGLGDCRFERANEAWGYDGGDAWTTAFSAKWEGSAKLPTLAFGNYLDLSRGRQLATCADNEMVRPRDGGTTYAEPIPLTPGWCTLSILFSDWDRSGRGDLRLTNDRHYYLDGEEQLWRVAEGEPPRLYTHEEGWQQMRIWGMGIASYDVTGDGLPEVFLTSQGDNKLQTLADGAAQPHYRDIALQTGVTAPRPYAGGDVLPSTAWHPEFQDVNNDGVDRPLRHQGQRRGDAGLRGEGSEQPIVGQRGRDVQRERRRRRHRFVHPEPWCRRRGSQPRRHARHRRGEPPRERQPVPERRIGRRRAAVGDGRLDLGAARTTGSQS